MKSPACLPRCYLFSVSLAFSFYFTLRRSPFPAGGGIAPSSLYLPSSFEKLRSTLHSFQPRRWHAAFAGSRSSVNSECEKVKNLGSTFSIRHRDHAH